MIAVSLLALSSCSSAWCEVAANASRICAGRAGVHYDSDRNVLCLGGRIDVQDHLRDQVLRQPVRDGVIVVARSEGGSLPGAIDIAEYLRPHRYSIVVDGICASACAQFLFVGADRKIIRGDGAVAMHGGPFSDAQIEALDMTPDQREGIRRERNRFVQFYKDRGVGIGLTNDFPPALLEQLAAGKMVFWVPKAADFARFNVTNITWCDARLYQDQPPPDVPELPPPSSTTPR